MSDQILEREDLREKIDKAIDYFELNCPLKGRRVCYGVGPAMLAAAIGADASGPEQREFSYRNRVVVATGADMANVDADGGTQMSLDFD